MFSSRLHRARGMLGLAIVVGMAVLVRSAGTGNGAPEASVPPFKHPKLATILAELAWAVPQDRGLWTPGRQAELPPGFSMARMRKSVRDAEASGMMRMNARGEIQVYVLVTAANPQTLAALPSAGATIEIVDAPHRIVQARVPVTRLEAVGALPEVRFVTLPNYGFPQTGSVDTQGDSILKDDQVRSMFHVDGTGVKVGMISDGLKGIFAQCPTAGVSCTVGGVSGGPISTGDLPSAMGMRNASGVLVSVSGGITAESFSANQDLEGLPPAGCGFAGAGAEGTALLEIVHDLAAGAQLFFANFDTSLAFERAVDYIASRADVGGDDIGFFALPYDGTSSVSMNTAGALNSSTNPVRAWVTSAGNAAVNHYEGAYVDSKIEGTTMVGTAGDLHLFQGNSLTTDLLNLGPTVTDKISLPPRAEAVIILTWNDTFGASSNDYDLFLVEESTGKVVASSTNPQTGTQDPVEFIDYINPATTPIGLFDIIIQNAGNRAAVRTLNLFLFTPECAHAAIAPIDPPHFEQHNYNTTSGSVPAESDAGGSPVSVVSVGAICSGVPQCPDFPNDPKHTRIEFFSSQGPTQDGRTKPDVTGIDGVSITGAGDFENPFFGTSAATPHAAGTDALLLQLAPCLLNSSTGALADVTAREDLHSLLLGNADPIGSPIRNDTYGSGRIDALAAALKTIPTLSAPTRQTISGGGALLQATGSDPDGCPLTYNWTGTCGSGSGPTPSPNCTPGSNTVSLSVTNNGVTFTPSTSIQVTATGFSLSVSPSTATLTAGQQASYTVTLSPQIGAFSNAITLGCSNLPSRSTCSFSPATVTPGANPTSSTLTVSTTAASAVSLPPLEPGIPAAFAAALLGLGGLFFLRSLDKLSPRSRSCGTEGPAVRRWNRLHRLIGDPNCKGLHPGGGSARAFAGARTPARIFTLLLLATLTGYLACGGGSSPAPTAPMPGTPAGTYTLTISGAAGSLAESATVTLTVQ